MEMSKLEAALWYASLGYSVFPCQPDTKIPYAGTNGSKDATTNIDKITQWWTRSPKANVAIATGSKSDLYVVDVDVPASEVLASLTPTLMSRTPSGGWHFVYSACGKELKNTNKQSDNAVHKDCDTRGDGGYIVVWPSTVDKKPYLWIDKNVAPVPVPDWIVDKVSRKQMALAPAAFLTTSSSWAQAALDGESRAVAGTSSGGRNERLNKAAFALGQLVAAGHLSSSVVESELAAAAQQCGLPAAEAKRTIASGLRGGAASPRGPKDRVSQWSDSLGGAEIVCSRPLTAEIVEDAPAVEVAAYDSHDADQWELLRRVRDLGGICDAFCSWSIRGAEYPQPALSIGALLALGSVLGGRRLVYRGALSGLYVVSIASSGEGKNRPKTCLERVLSEHWPSLIGPSSLSSSAAFVDQIKTATFAGNGIVWVLDEYGMQLGGMIGKNAASHRQDIKATLTDLATRGPYLWTPAVSLARGGGKLQLAGPCLSLHGSTTPESLHSVLTSTDVADGFVGRHLWFAAQKKLPMSTPLAERGLDAIPEEVVTAVEQIKERHIAWHMDCPVKGQDLDAQRLYLPQQISETPEATAAIEKYKQECDEHTRSGTRSDLVPSALRRAAEYATRVAGVLAVLSQPGAEQPIVTAEIVAVAIAIVEASNAFFSRSLRENAKPAWGDNAAQLDYVWDRIPPGGISRRDLSKACRALATRQFSEAIDRLRDDGLIQIETIIKPQGGRPSETIKKLVAR